MADGAVGLPAVLLRSVEKAINVQQAPVAGYVARLRRARSNATPAEIIAVLEKRYLTTVTGTGAAVGGAAAAPAVGTALAIALSGGETALFFEARVLFALAVAEVHGIRLVETERRRTLLLAVVLGDNGAMIVEKMTGRTGQHWADLLPEALPLSSITAINKALGRWFRRYARKQGMLALGRLALRQPDLSLAATTLEEARVVAPRSGDEIHLAALISAELARVAVARGAIGEARQHASAATAAQRAHRCRRCSAEIGPALVAAALAADDLVAADAARAASLEAAYRLNLPIAVATMRLAGGRLLLARGDGTGAAVEFAAALETFERLGPRHLVAETRAAMVGAEQARPESA